MHHGARRWTHRSASAQVPGALPKPAGALPLPSRPQAHHTRVPSFASNASVHSVRSHGSERTQLSAEEGGARDRPSAHLCGALVRAGEQC